MKNHFVRKLAALAAIGSLAACSGGGGRTVPAGPSSVNSGPVTAAALTSTLTPNAKIFSTMTKVGPATAVNFVSMHVVVAMRDAAGLLSYSQAVSNSKDPRYRQFLTASQIGDRFGARPADYDAVGNYLASYGLRVLGFPQRLNLSVAGSRSGFEKAFGTTFSVYINAHGNKVVAPTGIIHFAKPLPIAGLADPIIDPNAKHLKSIRGNGGGPQIQNYGGDTPQQVAQAFDYAGAYAAGYQGAGITIGIVGTGPIALRDFNTYKSQYNITTGTLTQVNVGSTAAAKTYNNGNPAFGGSPTAAPPPVTAPCSIPNVNDPSAEPSTTCNPEDGEAQIDTEQAALAPRANISFYLAYVPEECYQNGTATCGTPDPNTGLGYALQGLYEADDEIQQAIADNNGSGGPDVLSLSYGGPEETQLPYFTDPETYTTYNPMGLGVSEFAALATEGVAVFVSSGDQGAEGCAEFDDANANTLCSEYPSADVSVTSVGGVFAPLNGAGQLIGPLTGWGQQTGNPAAGATNGASGGGISTVIPRPSFETGPGLDPTYRNQPDISLLADPTSPVAVVLNTPFSAEHQDAYGGTSVAAPQMAAMWALVLSACKVTPSCATHGGTYGGAYGYRLGNAAPFFYGIYNNPSEYSTSIFDVTFGNNAIVGCAYYHDCSSPATPGPGYVAGTGYDHVTGIGVPFARHLIKSVVGV